MTNAILISKAAQARILFGKPIKKTVCIPHNKLHGVHYHSASFSGASIQKINSFLTQQIQ